MRKFLFFAPDPPVEGGSPISETPAAPAATPAPAGTPPPAAAAVIAGKTENEANLEKELEEERGKRKKAETDAAYAQDQVRTLKQQQQQSTEPPGEKRSNGWVFPSEE